MSRLSFLALFLAAAGTALAQPAPSSFSGLAENQAVRGFRTIALYLNDAGEATGARFRHEKTGFTLDLLGIQSVPQAFIWVNSVPTSDMGEPHTQEHLLLGKGNAGRRHANLEGMSVSSSSAFTQQLRTCYHFHTAAGIDVFFNLFESQMDALLHPDYTDEEIRREVCNIGVSENPGDGMLRLEEKGTVYNEMVSAFERGWSRMDLELGKMMYGSGHPLVFVSGGLPSAIRVMEPEAIRTFHAANYRLWNMGMIASFADDAKLDPTLSRLDAALIRLQGDAPTRPAAPLVPELPAPRTAPAGSIAIAEYPADNPSQPGPVLFSWPPTHPLDARERLLMEIFMDNIAGDASTNLYTIFVDGRSRAVDIGAQSVFGWVSSDQGNPVFVGLGDVDPEAMNEGKLSQVRTMIVDEIRRIASFRDGSDELKDFNRRVLARIIERRRSMRDFVNAPPGFGYRHAGSGWMSHLDNLAQTPGFRKSLTMRDELATVERLVSEGTNIWKNLIARSVLTESAPYAAAARANPDLIRIEGEARRERVAAALAEMGRRYGADDEQETIRRYKSEYDRNTAELDSLAMLAPPARFVDSPPFTLDDQIQYSVDTLWSGVPMVASTFENLTGATVGLALRVEDLPDNSLHYLSLLPDLLTEVGVRRGDEVISHKEMRERLRMEIRELAGYFSSNGRTWRSELVIRAAGGDLEESRRAIEWMRLALQSPDWRPENLPRIRELIDQNLAGLRTTMQGSEESWVMDPAGAYRRQADPVMLATGSFLTREHNLHRLRWLLKDAGNESDRTAISLFLARLADVSALERKDLQDLLRALKSDSTSTPDLPSEAVASLRQARSLPAGAAALAREAADDLDQILTGIPDGSLADDWRYLCRQIRHDLLVPPEQALDELNGVRTMILRRGGARMFMISSGATRAALRDGVERLAGELSDAPREKRLRQGVNRIAARVAERNGGKAPLYVGLVNPNTQGGVFIHSAPGPSYLTTDRESLLRFLASKLFSGHGAHSMFMKTWSAGLAYSNGLRISPTIGEVGYYAERCPELPQTLRFVIDELKRAPRDPSYVDYSIAQAFGDFRAASRYEARGEAIAADLADGLTPQAVAAFRKGILSLRDDPSLVGDVFDRMKDVYDDVLPGYGVRSSEVMNGVFFTIGPERQLSLYEDYLKSIDGDDAELQRLYPRDFWMPLPMNESARRD